MQPQQDINVLPMNFRADFVPDKTKPGELKEIHRVDLVKKGSNGESTPWTITALKCQPAVWEYVEPYYNYWLKGQEPPVDGTPVDVLPFLPQGLVGHLKNIHIRTAEDLRDATDADLDRIGMGARGYRAKARTYLDAKEDSKVVESNALLAKENEQLRADVDELKAQVNALVADKPRRGRPPKVAG